MANVQRKRMLWYYDAIIDWMIANPGAPLSECAAHVQRTPTTLSIIINSDMFKAALAARKAQFQAQHDIGLIHKTTKIANAGLDAILETLERKRSGVPIDQLQAVTGSALDRLGYGTKKDATAGVTINSTGNTQVVIPVTPSELEEARMAIRQVQRTHSLEAQTLPGAALEVGSAASPEKGAEPEKLEQEDVVASVIPST